MMPFPGGLEASANATLIFSLATGLLYLAMLERPSSLQRTLVKAGSIVLLVVLSILEQGPWLLIAALSFSAIGDACLSTKGDRWFLLGLCSFLVAHLLYAALFWDLGSFGNIFTPWRIVLVLALLVLAGGLVLALRPALPAAMRFPVMAYASAITAMGVTAIALPLPAVIAGAFLFIASDSLLASERFLLDSSSRHHAWIGPAVWILYWTAQALITISILAT